MTFSKPRFNKNYEWKLSRYATSKHVIGGAGKLLKYFERTYKPKNIITYVDRKFSQGNMYYKLGFTLTDYISPSYSWINEHHLAIKDNCNESGKSYTIYDCGKLIFEKYF